MQIIRLAAVGLGRSFERIHLPIIKTLPMFDLVAACDVDAEHGQRYASQLGVPYVEDIETLLTDPRIDAITVCTPPAAQLSISLRAISTGKHVLCEKPLGIESLDDVSDSGRLYAFLPYIDSALIRRILQTGRDDPVCSMAVLFGHSGIGKAWTPRATNWYFDRRVSGGGVLLDLGSHLLPLLPLLGIKLAEFDCQTVRGGDAGLDIEAVLTKPDFSLQFSWRFERSSEVLSTRHSSGAPILVDLRAGQFIHPLARLSIPVASYAAESYITWAQSIYGNPGAVEWTSAKLAAVKEVRAWWLTTQHP